MTKRFSPVPCPHRRSPVWLSRFGAVATLAALLAISLQVPGGVLPAKADPAAARTAPAPMHVSEFSRADVKNGLASGAILLVDVREADEFSDGHIPGARSIPLSTFRPLALPSETGKQVVLYCLSGARALAARSLAQRSGRSDIAVYAGSMLDWNAAGERIEK